MRTLYLIRANAAGTHQCAACGAPIYRGRSHFRHDPHAYARFYRGETSIHLCVECVLGAEPAPPDKITGRIRMPAVQVMGETKPTTLEPVRIQIVGIAPALVKQLASDPDLVYRLSATEFEDFVCGRLYAMGLQPSRVGGATQKDGGVDIVFWPRARGAFPFLGAAQVKHHGDPLISDGPGSVRDFAGAIAGHPFSAGVFVTNTSFTPDARWFGERQGGRIRLRDYHDVRRWMLDEFDDEAEWREMPSLIELCPGVVVKIRE